MKILVIKPSSLGDVIHALPFLNAVKEHFPDSEIDWVISKNLQGILEGHPMIHELLILNKDEWKSIRNIPRTAAEISALTRRLKSKHYDLVVDLQGLLRSGLIAFSTPTTLKVGFKEAREGSSFFYDKKVSVNGTFHAVDKCLEAAKAIGAAVTKAEFPIHVGRDARKKVRKLLGEVKNYIVVIPSARWITKRWPAENFAALISKISMPCVIAGSKADRELSQRIVAMSSGDTVIDLCGRTDLKELTALIEGARAVVTNDSGPMHIAAALDKPTIAIFGPTDPVKTGPYGWQKNRKLKVIKADVPCAPCRRKKGCTEFICMNRINAGEVYEALKEYL
jgi:lipopolysaccharide heptosyltransferase I